MNQFFYSFTSCFLPKFMFRFFLNYKNVFHDYLDFEKNKSRLFESDENKAFFLRQILMEREGIPQIQKTYLYDFMCEVDPSNPAYREKYVSSLKKMIATSYGTRQFHDFKFFLKRIEKHDPIYKKFYELYARQFLNADVTVEEWSNLLEQAKNGDKKIYRNAYSQLIIKYIHEERLQDAIRCFKEINQEHPFSKQDIKLTIGILKLALKMNEIATAEDFRKYISKRIWDKDLREFSKLKLFEIYAELDLKENPNMDCRNFSNQMFKMVLDQGTTRENTQYLHHLEDTYEVIGQRHQLLLDMRISSQQQEQLITMIREKIKGKTPFLLIRLGDADSYGLESVSFERSIFEMDCNSREMKWWGENLPTLLREKIRGMFRETVYASDVIGIPSIYRLISDLPDLKTSMVAERNQRGSIVVMDSMRDLTVRKKLLENMIFTENRCHHVLFNMASATEFARQAEHVVVVSHHGHEMVQKAFHFKIDTVQVPGEGLRHQSLPYKIDELISELVSKVRKGSLVFVASGFAGKYFLKVAKDRGAIGLDIGAMADYWVGIKSRGVSELV